MKICVVTHLFLPHMGGIERVVYEQNKRLLDRGYQPTVLTSTLHGEMEYYVDGLKVHCYPSFIVGLKYGIPYTVPKADSYKIFLGCINNSDIVHVHGHPYLSSYLALKIAKKHSKPTVLTQHNTFIDYGAFLNLAERINDFLVGKKSLEKADRIIVVSKATLNYISSLGVDPKKVRVLYNGVDLERFKPQKRLKRKIRRELSIPEDSTVFLTVRRLVYKNGMDVLLKSAALSVEKNPNLIFIVVGTGPDFEKINMERRRLRLEENFKLTGFVPDSTLPLYYNAADAFILPSKSGEGLPLVLLEALACGLPVIATDVGGIQEIVNDKCGKVVPPNDVISLANAIDEFSTGKMTFDKRYIRGIVEKSYDWNKNVENLIRIYEEII